MQMIQLETGVCIRLSSINVIQALPNNKPYSKNGRSYDAVVIIDTPRSTWRVPKISLDAAKLYRDQLYRMVGAVEPDAPKRRRGDSGFEEVKDEARAA